MRIRTALVLLVLLAPVTSRASEEEIHPWTSVAVTVDTGLFGVVEVQAATAKGKPELQSLAVKVKGKRVAIPPKALRGLPGLQLSSLAVHSERGYDKHPWLYVVFKTAKPGPKLVNRWLYFAIQQGKLHRRTLKGQTRANQFKFQDLP
jgi:hypothetical protein